MKSQIAAVLFASFVCVSVNAQLGSISRLINNANNVVSGITSAAGGGNAGSSLIGGSNNFGAGGFNQPGINGGTSQGFNFNNNPAFSNTNNGFTVNNGFNANPTFNNDGFNNPAFNSAGFNSNSAFPSQNNALVNPVTNNVLGNSNNNALANNNNAFPNNNNAFLNNNNAFGNNNNAFGNSNNAFGNNNNAFGNDNAFGNNNNIFGNNNNALGNTNSLTGRPSLANRLGINSNQLGGFQTGEVVGSLGNQNGAIVIAAEVRGGNPPPAVFVWRIQLPNGTFVDVPAGEGGSTAPRINNNGYPSTALVVTEPADIDRQFTLFVSSDPANSQTWRTSQVWDAKVAGADTDITQTGFEPIEFGGSDLFGNTNNGGSNIFGNTNDNSGGDNDMPVTDAAADNTESP